MHFSTLALLALSSVSVLAAPAKRADFSVDFYTDINQNGQKITLSGASGQCVDLPADLNDKASGVFPQAGANCTFWKEKKCDLGSDSFTVNSEGWWDLKKVSINGESKTGGPKTQNFNKKVSSFSCVAE
ncbi:hypothetical protein NX059_011681 [Plenodomus lindquistii]|nr:hypothetical protein NX059_011681 [Plenodomus lindquistii]